MLREVNVYMSKESRVFLAFDFTRVSDSKNYLSQFIFNFKSNKLVLFISRINKCLFTNYNFSPSPLGYTSLLQPNGSFSSMWLRLALH